MDIKRKVAVGVLGTAGASSYAAYEFSDVITPLSYSLDVPVMPTLEFSEDVAPSVRAYIPELSKPDTKGIQPTGTTSLNVMSEQLSSRLPDSKVAEQEKDKNQTTQTDEPAPATPKAPTDTGEAKVVQTNTRSEDPLPAPVVATPTPSPKVTTVGAVSSNPKNAEQKKQDQKTELKQKHRDTASSLGLKVLENYDASSIDKFDSNHNSTTKVQSFVVGEDANYVKDLWTSSIAIKHRKYWNLAPDDDPVWDIQLKNAQKRFYHHGYSGPHDKTMYAWVFGNFTMDPKQVNNNKRLMGIPGDINSYRDRPYMPLLNKYNLARTCKLNLARTPWGTWFSGARNEYWSRLWDFCAKPTEQEKGIPTDIDYWYRYYTGPRKQSEFNYTYQN